MKKRIHKKVIIRDGKEETIVNEESHVEQPDDAPQELRNSMQQVIDQFMEGSGDFQFPPPSSSSSTSTSQETSVSDPPPSQKS